LSYQLPDPPGTACVGRIGSLPPIHLEPGCIASATDLAGVGRREAASASVYSLSGVPSTAAVAPRRAPRARGALPL